MRRFALRGAALQAVVRYEASLYERSRQRRADGGNVIDQDQPEEVFGLFPPRAHEPALAIIGGMGPLAGAMAFRRACARFRDSRAIVLLQACTIPDRSRVILAEDGPDTPECRKLALRLADAVRRAVEIVDHADDQVSCIIACNSAHYFWRLLEEDLQRTPGVRMVSLVTSTVDAIASGAARNTLLLATEGARVGRVFSAPFDAAGIAFDEPTPAQSRLLMQVIFEGIKSMDDARAIELGNQLFESLLSEGGDYDCIVAGCTELPPTIGLLKHRGSPAVAAFLSRVNVVDPLDEAFARA